MLESRTPPEFLYTSGRPGRYNPRGTEALYASEDMPTAAAESDRYRKGKTNQRLLYWVHPDALVLDLENPDVLAALQLTPSDLYASWRFAATPTKTQLLGSALAAQTRLAGLRFPSDAARVRGFDGFNLVFFKPSVVAPATVSVRDDSGTELDRWPRGSVAS